MTGLVVAHLVLGVVTCAALLFVSLVGRTARQPAARPLAPVRPPMRALPPAQPAEAPPAGRMEPCPRCSGLMAVAERPGRLVAVCGGCGAVADMQLPGVA